MKKFYWISVLERSDLNKHEHRCFIQKRIEGAACRITYPLYHFPEFWCCLSLAGPDTVAVIGTLSFLQHGASANHPNALNLMECYILVLQTLFKSWLKCTRHINSHLYRLNDRIHSVCYKYTHMMNCQFEPGHGKLMSLLDCCVAVEGE